MIVFSLQDDKASLERLHGIIHGDVVDEEDESEPVVLQEFHRQTDDELPAGGEEPSTPKALRRRSLPTRASMTSIRSEYSVASMASSIVPPAPEENSFQARRKRAAKLTQFFGVDYRDLMSEILDDLENGLREEDRRGTLQPDEVQVRCCLGASLCFLLLLFLRESRLAWLGRS